MSVSTRQHGRALKLAARRFTSNQRLVAKKRRMRARYGDAVMNELESLMQEDQDQCVQEAVDDLIREVGFMAAGGPL